MLFAIATFLSLPVNASHIVGGDLTYRCLGNSRYQINIDIYEDCLTGQQSAIDEDDPAYVGIYTGVNFQNLFRFDSISLTERISVPVNFSNQCINNYPNTCLKRASFSQIYTLPDNPYGYQIVYQRCCRNATIINIANPGSVGATYTCKIPPSSQAFCNNSAVFRNYPPQIICMNTPLVYDHSATDADGDSLTYEFCTSYIGGSTQDAKPFPLAPPFFPVSYIAPFSATNPMGGFPPITIDTKTGMITGKPNIQGRFVVTVCCHEWRAGNMINTVSRDFQFVVTNCSKAVVADVPRVNPEANIYVVQCKDYTVHFRNTSTGGFSYKWDFGVAGGTSTDFEPTFTYPDTGTYLVKLLVNAGSTCPDSTTALVKVYPSFKTDFADSGLHCPSAPISFTDLSTSSYNPINSWLWNFGDNQYSSDQNPSHSFAHGNTYNVTLISGNYLGCSDTVTKSIYIENFHPMAGNDTIIVVGEHINFNATGGIEYLWTPAANLNTDIGPNPIGSYPDTGHFAYNVYIKSAEGCEANDSLKVWVVAQPSWFVPNAFTPNGDGKNDFIKPIAIGYSANNFFRIYDRFGEKVYESKDFSQGWDGNYYGQPAEVGTYFWELSVTNRYGKKEFYKGDLTLIR
ncbi:MAG: gliding motility-associated C-terminal domain-containing protein [Bacteroidetes bacterium]|nr:gliding motility-associated C-terminal domain-containing protein [Bacteroidota bacterium]